MALPAAHVTTTSMSLELRYTMNDHYPASIDLVTAIRLLDE